MFAAVCVIHGEECSAVDADGQGVASAVVRGTITLVPYSVHFGQVTLKGNVPKLKTRTNFRIFELKQNITKPKSKSDGTQYMYIKYNKRWSVMYKHVPRSTCNHELALDPTHPYPDDP